MLPEVAPSVFAFYLIVLANFLPETIGCRMQTLLRENMFAKHLVGFILLFFLIVVVNPDNADKKIWYNLGLCVVVYTWFLVTTRSPFVIAVVTLLLLLTVYILTIKKNRLESENDKTDEIKKIERIQNILIYVAIAISVVGFIVYFVEKQREYQKDFSFEKFFFGVTKCQKYTPPNAKLFNNSRNTLKS